MTPENSQSIKPIRPEEVLPKKEQLFPRQVIASFNELIAQNYIKGESIVLKEDVLSLMVENGLKKEDIYKKNWLKVEEIYENNGWKVIYVIDAPNSGIDKPSFVFTIPEK